MNTCMFNLKNKEKRYMKRIVCMIIVGIMMISLAACSQSGGEINSSEPTLSEGEISTDTDITTEGNSSNDEKNFIVNVRVR